MVIREIWQSIRAAPVPADISRTLEVDAGSAALELRRTYLDGEGTSQIITLSVLPAESYRYEIVLRRQG